MDALPFSIIAFHVDHEDDVQRISILDMHAKFGRKSDAFQMWRETLRDVLQICN